VWLIKVETSFGELNKNFKRKKKVGKFKIEYLYIK